MADNDVQGQVVDENGNPQSGATVVMFEQDDVTNIAETTTDANGEYVFDPDAITGDGPWHVTARWNNGGTNYNARSKPYVEATIESDIPDSVVAHYDAQELSGADGESVSTWVDETGNADATGGSPIIRDDGINGNRALEFDGTDDDFTASIGTHSQPNTIFAVVNYTGTGDFHIILDSDNSDGFTLLNANTGVWRMFAEDNLDGTDNESVTLLTAIYDGENSAIREDGTSEGSGGVAQNDLVGLTVGGSRGGESYWTGYIGEILVCDGRLSAGAIDYEEQRLADKWGITI